jgi:hypothetical protein
MESTDLLLLGGVVFLLLLAVGIIVAVMVYWRQSQSDKSADAQVPFQQQPRAQEPQPVVSPQQVAEPPPTSPPVEAPAHPGEVMRVIRDEKMGRVLVEVEGQRYTHIREIADARVGRRVLWAIADLVRFTGGMATNPQAVRSVVEQPTSREEPVQAPRQVPPTTAPDAERAAPSLLDRVSEPPVSAPALEPRGAEPPAMTPTGAPPAPPRRGVETPPPAEEKPDGRYSLLGYFRQGFEKQTPAESLLNPFSFIDEIEEILQQRVRQLAQPLSVEVHVQTGESGSLQILVGLDLYSSAEEVPDPQIRQLIQDAVSEWEQS